MSSSSRSTLCLAADHLFKNQANVVHMIHQQVTMK
ncbi:unnamed protein product [Trichobilharzia regenti]|nr:unnamed protein product [Trichobilharzia regenti]